MDWDRRGVCWGLWAGRSQTVGGGNGQGRKRKLSRPRCICAIESPYLVLTVIEIWVVRFDVASDVTSVPPEMPKHHGIKLGFALNPMTKLVGIFNWASISMPT